MSLPHSSHSISDNFVNVIPSSLSTSTNTTAVSSNQPETNNLNLPSESGEGKISAPPKVFDNKDRTRWPVHQKLNVESQNESSPSTESGTLDRTHLTRPQDASFAMPNSQHYLAHQPQKAPHSHHYRPTYPGTVNSDYETESEEKLESTSPPNYLKWANNLHTLLKDPDGVFLFQQYLELEGRPHADMLNFWLVCEGLRIQSNPEQVTRLIKAIYRRYFIKSYLGIADNLKKEVSRHIKHASNHSTTPDATIFNSSQVAVEKVIRESYYPSFLQSDTYIKYLQSQNPSSSLSGSRDSSDSTNDKSGSSPGLASGGEPNTASSSSIVSSSNVISSAGRGLATLHEDCVLESADIAEHEDSKNPLPLTKDMLLATQQKRASETRPMTEAYAGVFNIHRGKLYNNNNNKIHHPSYNPVSRQDSELQSLSSDARTESDSMSIADSTFDGTSHRYIKRQLQLELKKAKESASINRDPLLNHMVIPRTSRMSQLKPMEPSEFANLLTEKLEKVKLEQEKDVNLIKKLKGSDSYDGSIASFKENFVEDDNVQDILDQHCSRVWAETPPMRSPPSELRRVRPHNVPSHGSSAISAYPVPPQYPYQTKPHQKHSRKEKDVFSTFSSDSGNVHDFPEGSDYRLHLMKSKSMHEYEYSESDLQGYEAKCSLPSSSREWSISSGRKHSIKKAELTDSGVSVVSDVPPVSFSHNSNSRVMSWLEESNIQIGGENQMASSTFSTMSGDRDSSPTRGTAKAYKTRSVSNQPSLSISRSSKTIHPRSSSDSLEKSTIVHTLASVNSAPQQPFVADPCMPPLPRPHTSTQLEEARRRLIENDVRSKQCRQRHVSCSSACSAKLTSPVTPTFPSDPSNPFLVPPPPPPANGGLKKATNGNFKGNANLNSSTSGTSSGQTQSQPNPLPSLASTESYTTVVYSFCDEYVPYRTKIPGNPVTLCQFKEFLPKKGVYRYFFKTPCDDVDTKVIQEEIVDDNEVLPLWEGKIMCQVKPVE